jgi:hypothetical protein
MSSGAAEMIISQARIAKAMMRKARGEMSF